MSVRHRELIIYVSVMETWGKGEFDEEMEEGDCP